MVDTVLEVGAVRYELIEPLQDLAPDPRRRGAGPSLHAPDRPPPDPVQLALDVTFEAVTPAIGTDGQPRWGRQVGRIGRRGRLNGQRVTWSRPVAGPAR